MHDASASIPTPPAVEACRVGDARVGPGELPLLIAGPCVIEGRDIALRHAGRIKPVVEAAGFTYCFKASFDKANRTSIRSYRGPGLDAGLEILAEVRRELGVPRPDRFPHTGAGRRGGRGRGRAAGPGLPLPADRPVGRGRQDGQGRERQEGAVPLSRQHACRCGQDHRVRRAGRAAYGARRDVRLQQPRRRLPFTARDAGAWTSGHLRRDAFRAAPGGTRQHSGLGDRSGGDRTMVPYLARAAAAAVGVDGFFMEVHEDPEQALSDGPNMVPLAELGRCLTRCKPSDARFGRTHSPDHS